MTSLKTKSLSLPSDPVARLRELHELDNPAPAIRNEALPHSNGAAQQHSHIGTQQPGRTTLQQYSNTAAPEPGHTTTEPQSRTALQLQDHAETQPPANAAPRKRSNAAVRNRDMEDTENPVHQAMRQALLRPYPPDLRKGPTTATTIRIPTELWERLDMASTLLEQTRQEFHHKQDIIAEALKAYLTRIGRGEL